MSKSKEEKTGISELAELLTTRLNDISGEKSQTDVAKEVGFQSKNVLSIMKRGDTKLPLDRVRAMAKALGLDIQVVMMPALRQYFDEDTLNAIRESILLEDTLTEREIISLARENMDTKDNLTADTREMLKEVFSSNKTARQ